MLAPVTPPADTNQMKIDSSILLPFLFFLVCALPGTIQGFSMSIAANAASKQAAASAKRGTGDNNSELGNVPSALVEHAVAWASANGLGMVVNDDSGLFTSTHLPFSLLPYGERALCALLTVFFSQCVTRDPSCWL